MAKHIAYTSAQSHVSSSQTTVKKNLISKTVQVGASTLLSRLFGLVRELLTSKYLGVSEMADAFLTAFKIPNSMRKIFAEGALSAACVPTFVKVLKNESQKEASSLMSLAFLFFEGLLILFCGLIFWQADAVIRLIAPGWYCTDGAVMVSSSMPFIGFIMEWFAPAWYCLTPSAGQAYQAILYLRILISFIIFLSSSALLAGALQAVNHFFIPSFAPVFLNIVFISGLLACLKFGLTIQWLCVAILFGGFLQFLLHAIVYFRLNFTFGTIDKKSLNHFKQIMIKFLPCLVSMSILELNLFMSTSLATYLPKGSISLLYYANRFMGIPLGVLIGAFSTILLPYFSRISMYAPKRLSIYLLEASKVVFWITIPCTVIMSFLSEKIFHTLLLSEKFSLVHVQQASQLLVIFLAGLFFFSLYKIILNIYYALHDTVTPCYISLAVLVINYLLCKTFTPVFGVNGLALAFVMTNIVHVALFALFLYIKFSFKFYFSAFGKFVTHSLLQTAFLILIFGSLYYCGHMAIALVANQYFSHFLLYKFGFWFWVGPLCLMICFLLIKTRRLFNVRLYFLD